MQRRCKGRRQTHEPSTSSQRKPSFSEPRSQAFEREEIQPGASLAHTRTSPRHLCAWHSQAQDCPAAPPGETGCSAAWPGSQGFLQHPSTNLGWKKSSSALPQALRGGSVHAGHPFPAPGQGWQGQGQAESPAPSLCLLLCDIPAPRCRAAAPRSTQQEPRGPAATLWGRHPRVRRAIRVTGSARAAVSHSAGCPVQLHPTPPRSGALRGGFLTIFPASFIPPLTSKSGVSSRFPPCVPRRGVSSPFRRELPKHFESRTVIQALAAPSAAPTNLTHDTTEQGTSKVSLTANPRARRWRDITQGAELPSPAGTSGTRAEPADTRGLLLTASLRPSPRPVPAQRGCCMAGRCFCRSEKLLEENEPTADIPRRSPASWGGFSQQKRPPLLSS